MKLLAKVSTPRSSSFLHLQQISCPSECHPSELYKALPQAQLPKALWMGKGTWVFGVKRLPAHRIFNERWGLNHQKTNPTEENTLKGDGELRPGTNP